MNTLEILRGVRELLDDPAHWTQGPIARDASGEPTLLFGGDAVCWCLLGAFLQVGMESVNYPEARQAFNRANPALGGNAAEWNDAPGRQHSEVLAAIDRAVAYAEEHPE